MPLSLPNKDKKKKKIDEVEERLSPKKVSDLSFSEARAIREQYGSLKNYELATDKNRAKRIDEQMQDLSARRLVDAATSRGTPVEAESYGKNNKWNDYTTVMSERKSDYDRAVEKLKKDLDVYSPITDVSGVKNYLDATKAGYDNAIALGKSAADFGNAFKSADDFKRWSIGWDESRTGDKNFEDTEETRKARKDYYDGLKEKRSRLEAERTAAEQELYDFRQSDAYKNANYGSDEEKKNINTETGIQSRIWQYDADLEALDADIARYERFTEVQDKYAKLRDDPNFERYAEIEATHSGYGVDKNGNTINTGDNVVDNYFGVSEKYKDVNVTDPMFDAMYGVSDQERNLIEFGYDYSLDELTEEEKQTYRYLLATQGADSADQFLEEMKPTLNRRSVQREANELKNASGWELAIRNIASVPQNILGGVTAAIADVVQGDNKNPYDKWHRDAISASAVRGETAERMGNVGGFIYQSLMSAADSVAGAALMGRAYTLTMGAGASANRSRELYEKGASNEQILMSSLASGLTEVVTEYVSIDKFLNDFLEAKPKGALDLIKKVLTQGGVEASEEFAAEILNTIQDEAIMGSQSDWNLEVQELISKGKTREEAQKEVWLKHVGEAVKAAAGGFISGVAIGGGASAVRSTANAVGNAIDTRREGRYVNENNGAEALQNLAREVAGAPNLTKAADKVTKKASNKNVGKLSRALEQTIVNEADAETRSEKVAKYALAREGVDLSDIKAREGTKLYNNVDVSEKVSDTGTTVETETGGEITIDEKNPITQRDGKTYLNTSAGEILQDDIKYSSEKEAQLYEYVSDLPQSVANAIVENYKGQENVRGYVNGMRDGILLYGYNNIENAPKNTAFATLDKADQQYALARGRALAAEDIKAAEAKVQSAVGNHVAVKETATTSGERVMNLNEIGLKATPAVAKKIGAGGTAGAVYTKGDVDLNSAMGRADGLLAYVYSSIAGNSVVLYDSKTVKDADLKNANGKHVASDGTIYLDVRAEAGKNVTGGIAYTLGHELTHEAEQWAKKEYAAFKKFLYENYIEVSGKTNGKTKWTVEDLIAKKMSDLDTTDRAYAESEVVADACERMLLDSDAMEKLAELQDKEPGTFKKILDFIKRALEKIVGKFNSIREVYETMGAENTRIESKLVQEFGDNLKKLQDMWSDMVVKAAQNRAAAVESNALAYDFGASEQMAEEGSVQYSKVTDKKTLDFLNNQDYLRVFRAMALIDGKLYPPMATKVVKEGESKASLQNPTIIGEWYQSDERPDLANDKGMFPLRKPNGKTIWARYNPYWHTSATPLNDQFDEAHKRPELVVVEGIIPKSELTSGYKAYKAKDAVGATKWHSGEVAKQLKGAKARTVYLSRWFMAERVVPEAEVAKIIADTLRGENIYFPTNVVTPKLLEELRKTDVVLENSIDEKGNKIPEKVRKAAREGRTAEATETQYSRKVTPEENARYMELAKNPAKNEAELSRMVEEAAKKAGYDSPMLYHGTNAFGFTTVDNNAPGADGFSFWAANKPDVSATYTMYGKVRGITQKITDEERDEYIEQASERLDDSISEFRRAIDRTFSEWYFGQSGNSYLRDKVLKANPVQGEGDGVYDVLLDIVGDAWEEYGDTSEEFDEWQETPEWEAVEEAIIGVENEFNNYSEAQNEDLVGGIYELYANTNNMFVLDCKGETWNNLRSKDLPKRSGLRTDDAPYRTRDVANWAREQGYDGVIFKNIKDNGQYGRTPAGDVYAFFKPQSQVKSADPVTYDDQGNIIPLSKRFNENNDDIRYSRKISAEESKHYLDLARDPEANESELSRMVEEAAREAGYTVKAYHQTGADFTVFSTDNPVAGANDSETPNGIFFKMNDHDIGLEGKKQMGVYLKTGKMLHFKNREQANDWYEKNVDEYQSLQNEMKANLTPFFDELGKIENLMFGNDVTDERYAELDEEWNRKLEKMRIVEDDYRGRLRELLNDYFLKNDSGYGSIKLDYDGHRYVDGKRENVETIIVFDRNQIKSADPVVYDNNGKVIPLEERFNPENDDIRYSRKMPEGQLSMWDDGDVPMQEEKDLDQEFFDRAKKLAEQVGRTKTWTGHELDEFYKSNPQYDFVQRFFDGDPNAKKDLAKLLSKIDDVYQLDQMAWYTTQNHFSIDNEYRGAVTKARNVYKARIGELQEQKANGTEIKLERREYKLREVWDLFQQLNKNDAVAELASKVFDKASKIGINIVASNKFMGKYYSDNMGLNAGKTVWLRQNAFADKAVTDQFKATTIVHELIHACTSYALNDEYVNDTIYSDPDMVEAVKSLRQIYRQALTEPSLQGMYGLKSEQEFVAELANPVFREKLQKVNLWERIVNAIKRFFGIETNNNPKTMLDAASAALDYMLDTIDTDALNTYGMLQEDSMRMWERRNNQERYSRKSSESYAVRDIVDRALKRLDPSTAEYRAMAKYKAELDTLDNMRAQLDEAIKNGDRQAQTRLTNNIKTQRGILNRIENSASMKNVASMRDVTRLADDAKKLREMLKLQSRETNGTIAKQRSVNAAASEIMEKYGIKRGKGELNELLSNYYTKMMRSVNNETMTREAALDQAREAAEWIARHVPDEIQYDDGAIEALDMLRGYKVKLNDNQRMNIKAKYDSINDWRRAVGGYITLSNEGKYLDELWPEWAERAPGYFTDEMISDADMPERLADIIDSLKKSRETVIEVPGQYEYDLERAANDVYEAFWNIEPEQTVADKYAERIKTLKAEHNAMMSDLRKSFRDTIREERSEMYAEAKERAREYNEKLDLRRKVRKIKDDLTKRLDKPTIKKYVPKDLRSATSELLSALNLVSEKNEPSQRTLERIAKLQAIYDSYKDENIVYDKQVSEWLSELRDTVGSKSISELTKDELKSVYKILKAFTKNITEVAQVKSLYATGVSTEKTVDMVAKEWMRNIERINPALAAYFNTTGKLLGRPELVFRIFGNMDRNSISTKVYDALNAAQLEYNRIKQEGNRLFKEMFEGKANKKYLEELHDTKELYDIGLKDANGKPVEVTKDFALWLYRILMNENGIKHVSTTGGVMPDFKKYYNGGEAYGKRATRVVGFLTDKANDILDEVKEKSADIDEQIEQAKSEGDYGRVKELWKERDNIWSAWDQVKNDGREALLDTVQKKISDILTPQDKRFLELAAKFYDEWSKGYMNKASNERHGIDIADEENYTRIHTAEDYRGATLDSSNMESAIGTENMGFTKRRVGATNPIYFEGLSSAIAKHIDEVATYAAYLNPLYDLRKILNYTEGGINKSGTVRSKLNEKFGKGATNYIYRLAANVKGESFDKFGNVGFEKVFDELLGRVAEAALTANGRVVAYQAVSLLNAVTELEYGPVIHTVATKLFKKADAELIAKYTPILEVRRSNGGTDEVANMKNAAKNRSIWYKVTYPGTHAIQAMDLATVGKLWYASEYYVKKHNKSLKPGSEEFYRAVGKKMTEVVELTQPNYTPMQRNQLQRSKNPLARALAMFKTQPFQNLNNAIGASFQFAHDIAGVKNKTATVAEARESGAKLYRSISSLVISSAMMAVINAAWISLLLHGHWRWRDDETGEVSWEKFGEWFADEALNRLFGTDPLTSEAYNFIGSKIFDRKYYPGVSMPQVEVVTDALQSLSDSVDAMIDKKWNPKKEGREMATKIGRLFGIPVDSIAKPIEGVYMNVQDIINGEFGSFNYGNEYKSKQLAAQMLLALETDDEEKYEKARSKFPGTKTQTPEEQADAALKKAIGDMYIRGQYTYGETKEMLEEYLDKEEKEAEKQIDRWDYAKAHGNQDGYTVDWRDK